MPIHHWEIAAGCVALGAILGVLPYYLDYRAMGKALEINALGEVAEKMQNLETLSAQISSATSHWAIIQETVQTEAGKTTAAAKEIADQMAAEARQFSEFMQKMNDSEKATLRLEVEKLHRAEGEWVQMLVRILDHVFALHTAAVRTGDHEVHRADHQFPERLPRHRAAHRPHAVCRRAGRTVRRRTASGRGQQGKIRRPERSSPKPSAPATRFRENCCAPRSCACAKRMRPPQNRLKNPRPPNSPPMQNAGDELPL